MNKKVALMRILFIWCRSGVSIKNAACDLTAALVSTFDGSCLMFRWKIKENQG